MRDKEMKKLRRSELLELLIRLSEENEILTAETQALREQLENKNLHLRNAGSIAEAALQVSGIFESAQQAAAQYLENIQRLNGDMQAQADALMAGTREKCENMEQAARQKSQTLWDETKKKCDAMLLEAKQSVDSQWNVLQYRLDNYLMTHEDLKGKLSGILLPSK